MAAQAKRQRRIITQQTPEETIVASLRIGRDVERAEWRDPDDHDARRRQPRTVAGFRRIDQVVWLTRRGTITQHQAAAAMRLRDDYELSEGARVGGELGAVRGSGGMGPGDIQLDAVGRFRGCMVALGPTLSEIVTHVVLRNCTIDAWSERTGTSAAKCTGYLTAALDRLDDHLGARVTALDLERVV